jgi:hypothetical protein
MEYTFSWGTFFVGMLILLAGAALTIWYRPIADNLGSGVSSYDRYRLVGLIGCGVGFIVMLNLHSLILGWLFGMLFGGSS